MIPILVTGAKGQLGSEITSIANNFPQYNFSFHDIDTLDITNETAIKAFFDANQPKYLINCAAFTAVDLAEKETEKAFALNEKGCAYLARACDRLQTTMIHISTDFVFDGRMDRPYRENDAANPLCIYGKSKLHGEQQVLAINKKSVIIRTSWLYSSYGNNFVKSMLRLGEERDEVSVVNNQLGTPTYTLDLAQAIMEIIGTLENNTGGYGIFHYSNDGAISWYDFAQEIMKIAGLQCKIKPISTVEYQTPAERPKYSVLDKSKIKEDFGLEIPFWQDSLKKCLKSIEKGTE